MEVIFYVLAIFFACVLIGVGQIVLLLGYARKDRKSHWCGIYKAASCWTVAICVIEFILEKA